MPWHRAQATMHAPNFFFHIGYLTMQGCAVCISKLLHMRSCHFAAQQCQCVPAGMRVIASTSQPMPEQSASLVINNFVNGLANLILVLLSYAHASHNQ